MVEQPGVVVALHRAVVGDGIGVAAVVDELREEPVEGLRVPELVLRERAHRDVLLEERRDARPLRVREAEHELVVGHRQQQDGEGVSRGGDEIGGGGRHREPASPEAASFGFACGLACPAISRAAASLSRIT